MGLDTEMAISGGGNQLAGPAFYASVSQIDQPRLIIFLFVPE